MKLNNKKAQALSEIGGLSITIVTFSIIIIITFLILAQTKDAQLDFIDSTTFTNETITITIDSFSVIKGGCVNEVDLSIIEMINTTGTSSAIPSSNYTVSGNQVNLTEAGNNLSIGGTVNITYSCKIQNVGMNATEELQSATQTIPPWIPLIIVVVIGGIILAMITRFQNQ